MARRPFLTSAFCLRVRRKAGTRARKTHSIVLAGSGVGSKAEGVKSEIARGLVGVVDLLKGEGLADTDEDQDLSGLVS